MEVHRMRILRSFAKRFDQHVVLVDVITSRRIGVDFLKKHEIKRAVLLLVRTKRLNRAVRIFKYGFLILRFAVLSGHGSTVFHCPAIHKKGEIRRVRTETDIERRDRILRIRLYLGARRSSDFQSQIIFDTIILDYNVKYVSDHRQEHESDHGRYDDRRNFKWSQFQNITSEVLLFMVSRATFFVNISLFVYLLTH